MSAVIVNEEVSHAEEFLAQERRGGNEKSRPQGTAFRDVETKSRLNEKRYL
jgi:hypothetical protein